MEWGCWSCLCLCDCCMCIFVLIYVHGHVYTCMYVYIRVYICIHLSHACVYLCAYWECMFHLAASWTWKCGASIKLMDPSTPWTKVTVNRDGGILYSHAFIYQSLQWWGWGHLQTFSVSLALGSLGIQNRLKHNTVTAARVESVLQQHCDLLMRLCTTGMM